MDAVSKWLVRHPLVVGAVDLLVTLVLGFYAMRVRVESSIETVLPEGDPAAEYYAQTRATFGSDEVAVVGVRADDIFAPRTLEKIGRVTQELARIEGVERVLSITNAVDPAADVFDPPPLLPHLSPAAADIEALKDKLRRTPLYGKNLVADDFQGAAINVFFKNLSDAQYVDLGIDRRIGALLAAQGGPERFYYTGAGHLKQVSVQMMQQDLAVFTPIALALVLLVLWISFRTVRGVVLPMLAVLMALVWTIGIMVLLGKSITLGTFVLPPLVLVIGSSYGIHVMARYYSVLASGAPRSQLVLRAFRLVWAPLTISSGTNAIGFGALMVNRIPAIWDLGLFAVIGLACLTLTCLGFLPAALEMLGTGYEARAAQESTRVGSMLSRLGDFAGCRQRPILLLTVLMSLFALLGVRHIRVDSDFVSFFEEDSEVRVANEVINKQIVGSNPFYLVIEAPNAGDIKRWEVLKQIKELQTFLNRQEGITSSISIVDYLELLESGLNQSGEGDWIVDEHGKAVQAKPKTFWEDPRSLDPVLEIVKQSPETFKGVITPDFGKANVLVRTRLSGSREIEAVLGAIREYIALHFPAEIQVRPTGNLVLMVGSSSEIVRGQIEAVSIALAVIFAIMALMFLSARVGALAIIPNVLPILIFFGALGWFGIHLNLGTSLIATIALGIAVDSTVHFMARLNLEMQGESDQAAAVTRTLAAVGAPIVHATSALAFGFLTFAFSSFVPIQNFGILTGATMLTALAANLVLLPTLLARTRIITLWDLLSVRLGRDPGRTIPLFSDMRPAQARIVVLMGEMRRFGPGEAIVRRGEVGNEMYVILQGRTEVWAGSAESRRKVAELKRGDVFGEMGLIRGDERTADVVAAGPVEVFAVTDRLLERVQARYPRIAVKLYRNLTRILSDRLERTTRALVAAR